MTIFDMLEQSGILSFLGMAVVFAFLWIMIIFVSLTGILIKKFGLDKDLQEEKSFNAPANNTTGVTAAITAAVTEYQKAADGN
ncbi:MAG: OadG family protein [Treponema sp.]|nr:OadG family protein [Treponema sp.]